MNTPPTPPPQDSEDRPHIGRTTRSAFSPPGSRIERKQNPGPPPATKKGEPGSLLALKVLLAVWLALVLLSIAIPAMTPRTGDGFTRGLNRVYSFFGYQTLAGLVAFVTAYLSRITRPISKRWAVLGLVPLGVVCLLVIAVLVIIALARL